MLVEHLLRSPLVLQSSDGMRESRVTDARQHLCQAFRIQEGVSTCDCLQLIYPGISIHTGLIVCSLVIALQMTEEEQVQTMKQAIGSLFEITNLFSSSGDAGQQAEMRDKQMAYGILLHSCDLIDTKNAESKIMEMICKLKESSKVSIMQAYHTT